MQIPDNLFTMYNNAADDFINFNFGRVCRLYYPSKPLVCPNCIIDTITNQSTGLYNGTGPVAFTNGMICPVCNGAGFKENEITEDIKFRIYESPNIWNKVAANIVSQNTIAVIYGFITDLPKIQQMNSLLLDYENIGYGSRRCVLDGNPKEHGFNKRYFIAALKEA